MGGVKAQRSLHPQYHDWDALEQGTEPPTAPRAPQHKWLPTAPGVCSQCVCVCVCVCVLTAVCVHFGRVNCRTNILSMGFVTLFFRGFQRIDWQATVHVFENDNDYCLQNITNVCWICFPGRKSNINNLFTSTVSSTVRYFSSEFCIFWGRGLNLELLRFIFYFMHAF